MNIDKIGKEHIIDEDLHGDFDENLFHALLADDILDPYINQNNPNMEGGKQCAGQQGQQRMVDVDPMRSLPRFSGEKTESTDKHLDALDIVWKYKKLMLLMPM